MFEALRKKLAPLGVDVIKPKIMPEPETM